MHGVKWAVAFVIPLGAMWFGKVYRAAPEAEQIGSSLAGRALPMSGFDAILAVMLVFAVVGRLLPIRRPRAIAVPVPAFP